MILTFLEASEHYGFGEANLSAMINYDKKKGTQTHWLLKTSRAMYVDTKKFEIQSSITRRAYQYNTDSMYWLMTEIFGRQLNLAKFLAKNSSRYKSALSWNQWLSLDMWVLPLTNRVRLEHTLHSEFLRISVKTIALAIKSNIKLGKDWE